MAYYFLSNKDIDLSHLGYKNASLQFDFNKESGNLRITLFENNHYQDEAIVNLEDKFGKI